MVRILESASEYRIGNRYDEPMVVHDVSASGKAPGTLLLVARLHVDLCRLASAICRRPAAGTAV
ncbi:hypothetical protein DEH18_04590 [Streptomyces sp. NHF165]|nr:hypothetical protein DEH18_04590 [Streptomyces sp. NHF165]